MKKNDILKGSALALPVSIEQRYRKELEELTRRMAKDVRREILALFRSDMGKELFAQDANIASQSRILLNMLTNKYEDMFAKHGALMAERMVKRVDKESKARLNESFKKLAQEVTLKVSDMPARMKEIYTASINENVDLIKSIPTQYLDRVKGSVMRSITNSQGGLGGLIDDLTKFDGITERRAKNIALDQTRKAYNAVNLERSRAAGIKQGIWIHTGGTKEPRIKHKEYNGKVFSLAEGAPVGNNGEYVMPGEEPFCRCVYQPVIDFGAL